MTPAPPDSLALLALAADAARAAADLLTGPGPATEDVRFLATAYLTLAGGLVDASPLADPYLPHLDTAYWSRVAYWYKWLNSADLTVAQETTHATLAATWDSLLVAWDAAHSAPAADESEGR